MNFPILSAIIFIPLVGSLFILVIKGDQKTVVKNSKYVAIFSSLANFFLSLFLWYSFDTSISDFQFASHDRLATSYTENAAHSLLGHRHVCRHEPRKLLC